MEVTKATFPTNNIVLGSGGPSLTNKQRFIIDYVLARASHSTPLNFTDWVADGGHFWEEILKK
jgi:hypothetical protein